ncbi:MAG TPA: FtsX-like permease family protein [Aggregicoccus sp.]|nr:FtsX-like permease family protein [Aggregicoccus sp.]
MRQLILIAFRNLLAHRRRTLLLGGAIAFVTALFVLMTGLANGMRATMLESATTLSTGHVNVGGFFKVAAGQSAPAVTGYAKVLELVKREVPEVDYVTHRGRGFAKLVSEEGSMYAVLSGLDVAQEPGFRRTVVVREGRLEDLDQPGTILLFEEQVKKLNVKVGDVITLSAPTFRGVNNTQDVRVAAIAADMGMMSAISAYIPAQSLRDLYQYRPDTTGVIQLYLKDVEQVPAVRARLREALAKADYRMMDEDPRAFFMKFDVVNREGWTGQKLDVTTWEEELSFVNWVMAVLGLLTVVLTAVLLVIIAVGIMNTLWIAIRERTREVGTLRAIGMQRGRVLAMFMVEALMLSLFGTLLGALLGIALCEGITAAHIRAPEVVRLMLLSDQWYLRWQPGSVIAGVLIVTVCSMLVSLIPSFLAARMKPVTAMHYIG